MAEQYIVHYGELGLKGRNRISFEHRLVSNLRKALGDLGRPKVERFHSYLMVTAPEQAPLAEVESRLRRIPGIAYSAPVTITPLDIDAITAAAVEMASEVITPETRFPWTKATSPPRRRVLQQS